MAEIPDRPFCKKTLEKERKQSKEKAARDARPYRNSGLTWGEYKALPYNEQRGLDIKLNMQAGVVREKVECATGQDYWVTRTKQSEPTPVEPPRPPLVLTAPPCPLPRVRPRLRPKRGHYYKPYKSHQLSLPFPA